MSKKNIKFIGEAKLVVVRSENNGFDVPCIQMGEKLFPFAVKSGNPQKNHDGEQAAFLGKALHDVRLIDGVIHQDDSEKPQE